MKFPERLTIVDGELQMLDGSDVKEYLKMQGFEPGRPVTILDTEDAQRMYYFATAGLNTAA